MPQHIRRTTSSTTMLLLTGIVECEHVRSIMFEEAIFGDAWVGFDWWFPLTARIGTGTKGQRLVDGHPTGLDGQH